MKLTLSAIQDKEGVLSSLLLAFFIDIKIISSIIDNVFPSMGRVMTLMYILVIFIIIGNWVIGQKASTSKISIYQVVISIIIFGWYYFTSIFIDTPSVDLSFFLVFTMFSFIAPSLIKYNIKLLLTCILILPSWGVLFSSQIFLQEILEFGFISMGLSYALLIPVLATIAYLIYYYNSEKRVTKFLMFPFIVCNAFYLIQLITFGSRGPILCIALALITHLIIKVKRTGGVSVNRFNLSVIFFTSIIILISFKPILIVLEDFFAQYDIKINFIDKFLRLDASKGDMSNGRDFIIHITINGIYDSPISGHGTAQFENNTGKIYPHNFILQFLYDGGIILTTIVFIPIIKRMTHIIKKIQKDWFIWLFFLSFASIPGALFSGDLWKTNILWILFGTILSNQNFKAIPNSKHLKYLSV